MVQWLRICFAVQGLSVQSLVWKDSTCCCCSVTKSCLTFCDPRGLQHARFPVLHYFLEFPQIQDHWVRVMPYNHLILCRPLLLLPSAFPSIREDPTYHGIKPEHHTTESVLYSPQAPTTKVGTLRASSPQQEKPPNEKPAHHNEE